MFLMSCGGPEGTSTGTGSTGGSDVSLTGTVTTPTSTSKSVSLGLSGFKADVSISKGSDVGASKSSDEEGFEVSRVIVSKGTSDQTANSGTCTVEKLDGTVIDTCDIQGGVLLGCNFDQGKIPSDGQVEIICKSGDDTVTSLCDCFGIANGTRCSCGTINADTTLTDTLLHTNIDPNANPEKKTSTFTSSYGDGTLKPRQVFQTLKEQFGTTAGSSDGKGAMTSVLKAVKGCMATLTSFTMADMASMIQTGAFPAGCKSADSDLAGIDLTAAAPLAFKSGGATVNFFKDSTTADKWKDATAWQALAKNLGGYGASGLTSCIDRPENCRGLLNRYVDDQIAGVADPFKKIVDGSKSFGSFIAKFKDATMSSGQFLGAKDLFDNCTYGGNLDKLGEAIYSQIFSADSEAEITKLRANKGSIGSLLVANPLAYAGNAGAAQGLLNLLGTGGSIIGATPCASDSDCGGGKLCGTSGLCFASVAGLGTGTGDIGAVCSAAGDCKSNVCTSSHCDIGSGVSFATLGTQKYFGQGCTTTAECSGGLTCNTTCGGTAPVVTNYYAYVAGATASSIIPYTVNSTTGALTEQSAVATVSGPQSVGANSTGTCAFVTGSAFADLRCYSIAAATGALTTANTVSTGTTPQGVAVTPNGSFVYVANFGSNTVSAFTINSSTCACTSVGAATATGTQPQGIAATNSVLVVANNGSANVSTYTINAATGALTAASGSPFAAGTNPGPLLAINSAGTFAFVPNFGSNNVSTYTINAATGALTAVSGSPFSAGSGPSAVAVAGVCTFVVNTGAGTVQYYTTSNGVLSSVGTAATGASPLRVAADPTGKFAYVTNNVSNTVSGYDINTSTCALTAMTGSPFAATGSSPAGIVIVGRIQ